MEYDINFYTKDKAQKRDDFFSNKPLFSDKGIDTNKIFFDYLLDSLKRIKKNKQEKIKILDLGTGTGYVPKVLCQLSDENFEIIGVDLAQQMLDLAKERTKDKRVKYVLADNQRLPFANSAFDIITNKLTTQFEMRELNRVLKQGGLFIFKEYDRYKGFKEIFNLFKDRFIKIKKGPADYYEELAQLGFQEIVLRKFIIKRDYQIDEINNIFAMANIIENFNPDDLNKIKNYLGENFNITSDPFIIYAQK